MLIVTLRVTYHTVDKGSGLHFKKIPSIQLLESKNIDNQLIQYDRIRDELNYFECPKS